MKHVTMIRRGMMALLALVLTIPALATAQDLSEAYDVLILGGRIVDGTGNASFYGEPVPCEHLTHPLTPQLILGSSASVPVAVMTCEPWGHCRCCCRVGIDTPSNH